MTLILENFAGRTPGALAKQRSRLSFAERHLQPLWCKTLLLASPYLSVALDHPSSAVSTCKISTRERAHLN